jgi:very-short-patch-repair endonuclease
MPAAESEQRWRAGDVPHLAGKYWLHCTDSAGKQCSRCYQAVALRTWQQYRKDGTLPNCRAHGVHAHAAVRAMAAALTQAGHQGSIWFEQAVHSDGTASRSHGRYTKRCQYRLDMGIACASGATVMVELDGREHHTRAQRKIDQCRDRRVAYEIRRLPNDRDESWDAVIEDAVMP